MTLGRDQIDQDALAAEWGLALEADAADAQAEAPAEGPADGAEAAVLGSALSSFARSSAAQTVQFGGSNCYYADGWNGRGWYQCGNEWNDGFGWIGPFNSNTFGGSAIRRHQLFAHSRTSTSVRLGTTKDARRIGKNLFPVHR